jgi:kynurenine formamidase
MTDTALTLRSRLSEPPLDEPTMRAMFDQVCNWGRWGAEDEMGALNFITPETRLAAARLVESGESISLSHDFPTIPHRDNPYPAHHHMTIAGDDSCCIGVPGIEIARDYIGIHFHGMASSHIDALCHIFADGRMYNGVPASEVKSTGARRNSIHSAHQGITGRGVLLDLPRAFGRDYIDPAELIGVAELEAAERACSVTVGRGDILLIRMGREVMERDEEVAAGRAAGAPLDLASLHPSVVPWLHQREIAVLGSDGVHDATFQQISNAVWPVPIHTLGIVAIGLHLLDNLALGPVAAMAAEHGRWAFHLCIAPLRVVGGTGSPVNPIATF